LRGPLVSKFLLSGRIALDIAARQRRRQDSVLLSQYCDIEPIEPFAGSAMLS
jgi:hypothetical protein